jgi:hypothetical protein
MSDIERLRELLRLHDNDPDFHEYAGDLPDRMMDLIERQAKVIEAAREVCDAYHDEDASQDRWLLAIVALERALDAGEER